LQSKHMSDRVTLGVAALGVRAAKQVLHVQRAV
jgi:hypothetical protein